MSIQTVQYKMPQPEQWLSEHPVMSVLLFGAIFASLVLLGLWVG